MIIKEIRETAVAEKCDVLVCGGGFSGISAALAAARCGKKVILLEKEYMLGGLGTLGLITIYLPLCDGLGNQVCFGIAEELFRLSISMGAEGRYPENWLDNVERSSRTVDDKRFEVQYNPQLFAILAEQLLLKEGVEICYGAYAVAAIKEGNRIKAVIIESKSGRQAIIADAVVDATGDCDIAYFADAPVEKFKQGNVLAAWYYRLNKDNYQLKLLGFSDIPEKLKTKGLEQDFLSPRRYEGLERKELTEYVVNSHAATLDDIRKSRKHGDESIPLTIAAIPQIRMTRKIVGEYVLDDTEMHKSFGDSIGMIPDWRRRGPVYEVPFRCLYSRKVKNLITAGRCISVTDAMWDISRVIPCCAVTGQAAGTAAAMTDDFSGLDVNLLQKKLVENNVVLHETVEAPKAK